MATRILLYRCSRSISTSACLRRPLSAIILHSAAPLIPPPPIRRLFTTTTTSACLLRPLSAVILHSAAAAPLLPPPPIRRRLFATTTTAPNANDPNCSSDDPPPEGCDFQHWLVVMEPPKWGLTRDEIIHSYIKIFAAALSISEEEARMKIYSVSTRHYFAFGALVSEDIAYKLSELPNVKHVLPDSYLDVENKDYGGEPFINGQAVSYDPKYHKEWIRTNSTPGRNCTCGSPPLPNLSGSGRQVGSALDVHNQE